ncbi:hypothetical protein B0H19DRAFT_1146874 [Mycena capillaripes]|nr:hypothetical protein B0H19DRAFT_1146874 [Mycena capillaripes]
MPKSAGKITGWRGDDCHGDSPSLTHFASHTSMNPPPYYRYEYFLKEFRPEIEQSKAPQLLKLLDKIAAATHDIFLDFTGVFDRVSTVSNPHPVLDDLREVYIDLLNAGMAMSRACNRYMACCIPVFTSAIGVDRRIKNPDPDAALKNFDEQYGKMRQSISRAERCWDKTVRVILNALAKDLRMPSGLDWVLRVESVVFPWFYVSRCVALCDCLPALMKDARGHLATFGELHESLQAFVMEVDSARVNAPDDTVFYAIREARSIPKIISLFRAFQHGLASKTDQPLKKQPTYEIF